MADAFEAEFAATYFKEWVPEAGQQEDLPVPDAGQLMRLTSADAFEDPEKMDAAQLAAAQAAQASNLGEKLGSFTKSADSAKSNLNELRKMYDSIRETVQQRKDIVALILGAPPGPSKDLDDKILGYLVQGTSYTRLGEEIVLPTESADDRPLLTLLGMVRVVAEHYMDERLRLPWLADDDSAEARRFKLWERSAGALGDTIGAALGRAAAVTMSGIISPVVKLPDELTLGISYVAGISTRKAAEHQMHRFLLENPNVGSA